MNGFYEEAYWITEFWNSVCLDRILDTECGSVMAFGSSKCVAVHGSTALVKGVVDTRSNSSNHFGRALGLASSIGSLIHQLQAKTKKPFPPASYDMTGTLKLSRRAEQAGQGEPKSALFSALL